MSDSAIELLELLSENGEKFVEISYKCGFKSDDEDQGFSLKLLLALLPHRNSTCYDKVPKKNLPGGWGERCFLRFSKGNSVFNYSR